MLLSSHKDLMATGNMLYCLTILGSSLENVNNIYQLSRVIFSHKLINSTQALQSANDGRKQIIIIIITTGAVFMNLQIRSEMIQNYNDGNSQRTLGTSGSCQEMLASFSTSHTDSNTC
jgi:hypothetical protein